MLAQRLDAYEDLDMATMSGREVEAAVLLRAARRLAEVRRSWHEYDDISSLDDALLHNQRIWTLFQTELTETGNPLPAEIKLNMLRLAAFVDRRTYDTLSYPELAKLDILIDINMNIAAGLRSHTTDIP